MSEKQFAQKRKSMEKEIRGSRLVPESEFLDRRKTVTDTIVSNFEYFKMEKLKRAFEFQTIKKI